MMEKLPHSDAKILTLTDTHVTLAIADQIYQQLKPKTPLGIYFEKIWIALWQSLSGCQLLAHNLPVYDKDQAPRQTLGAFDALIEFQGEYFHIESCVKFYLGLPNSVTASNTSWAQWIGPDAMDRLDQKLNHLIQRQLPLSQSVRGEKALHQRWPHIAWQRALCMQGYFFYPIHGNLAAPENASPSHARGVWWYAKDFLKSSNEEYWLILPKRNWLARASCQQSELLTHTQLHDLIKQYSQHQQPVMLAKMRPQGDNFVEDERHVVVWDQWPSTDRPSRNT